MIVAVEGVLAVGKTTWCGADLRELALITDKHHLGLGLVGLTEQRVELAGANPDVRDRVLSLIARERLSPRTI